MEQRAKLFVGDELNKDIYISFLESKGIAVDESAFLHILIDRPLGWAALDHPDFNYSKGVIFTDNLCPSYQLDLISRRPLAIASLSAQDKMVSALAAAQTKKRMLPAVTTPLSTSEREVLSLVAKGLSNKAIAKQRASSESTVKNQVQSIYKKLNLHSRVQLAHYYYGFWHLLENWNYPDFIADLVM